MNLMERNLLNFCIYLFIISNKYINQNYRYNLFRNSLVMTLLILLMIVMMAMKSAGMHVVRSEMFAVVLRMTLNAARMKK
jgi:hypothetical protein